METIGSSLLLCGRSVSQRSMQCPHAFRTADFLFILLALVTDYVDQSACLAFVKIVELSCFTKEIDVKDVSSIFCFGNLYAHDKVERNMFHVVL